MSTAVHREVKGLAWVAWHGLGAGRHACKLSCFSRVQLFVTSWTIAHQVPLSMEFSRQTYWSGLPFPPPGDLPNPGIKPKSSTLLADLLPSELSGKQRAE